MLISDPSASVVSCGIRIAYGDSTVDRVLTKTRIELRDLLRDRLTELHPSSFLMRRAAVVDGFGLVSEEIPGSFGEDYEFLLRAARTGPVRTVPKVGVVIRWHKKSYFTSRWETMAQGLTWLLETYPEFARVPAGKARISGQVAFATAAGGHRKTAVRWAGRTVRRNPLEPRAYLALAVASGAVKPDTVVRQLHSRGRGIFFFCGERLAPPGIGEQLPQLVFVDGREAYEHRWKAVVVRLSEERGRVGCEQHVLLALARDADRHDVGARDACLLRIEPFQPGPDEALELPLVRHAERKPLALLNRLGQRQRDAAYILLVCHVRLQ